MHTLADLARRNDEENRPMLQNNARLRENGLRR